MFQNQQTIGVFLAVALLIGIVLIAVRATKGLIEKDKITFLMVLLVSLLGGIWAVDKVIAFRTHLLDADENKFVMQTMAAIIFYILGRPNENKKNDDKI